MCFDADCDIYQCAKAKDETIGNETSGIVTSGNETISVCVKTYRSDLFSFRESRQGAWVRCAMQTEKIKSTSEFYRGSTNVRKIEFTTGMSYSALEDVEAFDADEETELNSCEIKVDGVDCNSCSICEDDDISNYAIDCTNIAPTAITSCDSSTDLLYGIVHKLLVLEEGFTHEPTTVPTDAPAGVGPPSVPFKSESYATRISMAVLLVLVGTVASFFAF
jgi:hypothetical protein